MSPFDCRNIELILQRYRAGQLSRDEIFNLMDHLDVCPCCAAIFAKQMLAADSEFNPQSNGSIPLLHQPSEDFTSEVLAKTSGTVCFEAQWNLACGYDQTTAEKTPASPDPVLNQHLEHCSACREFQQTLPRVMGVLHHPDLWEPDPCFVEDVLDETSRSWFSRIRKWLQHFAVSMNSTILTRPRFALETAYIATLIVVLLVQWTGIPISNAAESLKSGHSVVERFSLHEKTIKTHALDLVDDTRDAVRDCAERTWNAILGYGSDAMGWLLKHMEDSNGNEPCNGNNETRR